MSPECELLPGRRARRAWSAALSNDTLDKLAWVLIYGGLLLLSLGLFVWRVQASRGLALVALGALLAVLGAIAIWARSRRPR
jgi:hypothetical protein